MKPRKKQTSSRRLHPVARPQIEPLLKDIVPFINSFSQIQRIAHNNAVAKGFWAKGKVRNDSEAIMLMVCELAEAVENLRAGCTPDDKIPGYKGIEAELADCIIRIMDLAEKRKWRIAGAIIAKMGYNANRPKLHGKKF